MIHACRIAMSIGFIATGIGLVIGIIVGGLMGYFSGIVDLIGMRLVEIFSAIPTMFLLLALVATFGRNLYLMMVIIGLTGWVGDARFVRAEFLKLRNQDFVQAALAAGLPLHRVLFRHILPNALAPLLVSASFGVASAVLVESSLSFLGLGLVDEPSWGDLLNQAVSSGGGFVWWLAVFPGLAIFLTIFAYNLVGESLRDALDPRLYGGRA
jgi:peptide/nickel transport system permease protein